jgi:hypothetical protein
MGKSLDSRIARLEARIPRPPVRMVWRRADICVPPHKPDGSCCWELVPEDLPWPEIPEYDDRWENPDGTPILDTDGIPLIDKARMPEEDTEP